MASILQSTEFIKKGMFDLCFKSASKVLLYKEMFLLQNNLFNGPQLNGESDLEGSLEKWVKLPFLKR